MSAWHLFCCTIWSSVCEGEIIVCLGEVVYFVFWGLFYVFKTRLGQCLLYWPVHAKKEKMLLVEGLKLDVINLPFLKWQIPKPWFVSIYWGLLLVMSATSESATHRNPVPTLSGTNMLALKWIWIPTLAAQSLSRPTFPALESRNSCVIYGYSGLHGSANILNAKTYKHFASRPLWVWHKGWWELHVVVIAACNVMSVPPSHMTSWWCLGSFI